MRALAEQRSNTPARLAAGDPAPWFIAATATNPRYDFSSAAGRYVLLVFPGPGSGPAAGEAHRQLLAAREEGLLDDKHGTAFAVSLDPSGNPGDGPRDAIPGFASCATAAAAP